MNLKAFHNDPKIKKKYLTRVRKHFKADEIVKGTYWENGKGCAVGCTIHSDDHNAYESEIGIPIWLAFIEDRIFERLSNKIAKEWPLQFLKAIPIGVDLEKIKAPFFIFILKSTLNTFDHNKFPECKKSVEDVINLWKLPEAERIDLAAGAAYVAAHVAARAAAGGAIDVAAYAAGYDAPNAARASLAAANAAANIINYGVETVRIAANATANVISYAAIGCSDDCAADCTAASERFADELLKLMKECK